MKTILIIILALACVFFIGMGVYHGVPEFQTWVDEKILNIEQEKEPEVDAGTEDEKEPAEDEGNEPSTDKTGSENEGTGEGEQIPETAATVCFSQYRLILEV